MAQFDYLIVGAGPFGSTFARRVVDAGHTALVIDRREHIGGNVFDEKVDKINVHRYGPHIFHTNNERVWNFLNQFTQFSQYEHRVKGINGDRIFSVPVNLMTMHLLWGVTNPREAQAQLEQTRVPCFRPENVEQWALHTIGRDLYELVVRDYTEKQWGRPCAELPARIIQRLPVRMTWDDRYHNSRFSGLPVDGYTSMMSGRLDGIPVELGSDFFAKRDYWEGLGNTVVYTGPIDRFYDYRFGELAYRSLRFETTKAVGDVQGCPQLNHTGADESWTRRMEWKHFERIDRDYSVLTREYPQEWTRDTEAYYPIADADNLSKYKRYETLTLANTSRTIIGGRLGTYKYLDMDQTFAQSLQYADRYLGVPQHGLRVA